MRNIEEQRAVALNSRISFAKVWDLIEKSFAFNGKDADKVTVKRAVGTILSFIQKVNSLESDVHTLNGYPLTDFTLYGAIVTCLFPERITFDGSREYHDILDRSWVWVTDITDCEDIDKVSPGTIEEAWIVLSSKIKFFNAGQSYQVQKPKAQEYASIKDTFVDVDKGTTMATNGEAVLKPVSGFPRQAIFSFAISEDIVKDMILRIIVSYCKS